MTDAADGLGAITSYHTHIYYDPQSTRAAAERLRERVAAQFRVQLGRWHDKPVGPHARAMFQIAFETELFATLVPFLMLNRDGLAVFVHPNTSRPRDDHLLHAIWMGEMLPLDARPLPETDEDPTAAIVPNTDATATEAGIKRD
jgi:aromatic ring-cleaving dioxygenase